MSENENIEREASLGLVSGSKGSGKTYTTIEIQINQTLKGDLKNGVPPRKVLILDANNEYGDLKNDHKNKNFPVVQSLGLSKLKTWVLQKTPEARRIAPFKEVVAGHGGGTMNTREIQETLMFILHHFKNGLLIIEDLTNYVSDSLPSDLIGKIVTQRHVACDIIAHFQSISKSAHPQLWAQCTWFRLHLVGDTMEKQAKKMTGDVTALFIGEKIIKIAAENGNTHQYIYYNKQVDNKATRGKITGYFSEQQFMLAVEEYLTANMGIVRTEEKREELRTGKKIHADRGAAVNYLLQFYTKKYYGNPKGFSPKKFKKT